MKPQLIELDKIVEPIEQVRKVIDSEKLDELAASVKQIGLIEPIVVKDIGDKYEVVAGHRRLLACRIVQATPVPCMLRAEGDADEAEVKLHENFFREDINAADEAEFYSFMISKQKLSIEEMAKKIHKSGTYIRDRLNLLRGDQTILEAVRDGVINAGVAKELNIITEEEVRIYYLKYAIDSGVKIRTAQEWRKQWERERRTQEALDGGTTPDELPAVLPEYYCKCPMCEQPTELSKMRAISVCEICHKEVLLQFQAAAKGKQPQ